MEEFRIRLEIDQDGTQEIYDGGFSNVKEVQEETKANIESAKWECYLILIEKKIDQDDWEIIDSLGSSVHDSGHTGVYTAPDKIEDDATGLRETVQEMWDAVVIEHLGSIKVDPPYGLAVGLSDYRITAGVIGRIEQSHAGNAVLHIGNQQPGARGWVKVAHVVLTPVEREALIADLIAQRD